MPSGNFEDSVEVKGANDQQLDLQCTAGQLSHTKLLAVNSNGKLESQLQFEGEFSFVSPIAGKTLLTLSPKTDSVGIQSDGDVSLDLQCTAGQLSHTKLLAVNSNGKLESQLQFEGEFSFGSPIAGKTLLTLSPNNGTISIYGPDESERIRLDGTTGNIILLSGGIQFPDGTVLSLFPGTSNNDPNRYLQILNSPSFSSPSGLMAGGVLVSDDYRLAQPGKNDLVVKGSATVYGDVILAGGDCAEDFDVSGSEEVEPGTVLVMNQEGVLEPCCQAYDKTVAGVISGAGDFRPGIVLDKQRTRANRMPVALLGKVYCKVDASYARIEVGDLLVTSPTRAHAMKANDPMRAFGAVIGKALRGLENGCGLIPILVSLQ